MLKETISEFIKNVYSNNDKNQNPNLQKVKFGNLLWSPFKMLFINFQTFILVTLPFSFIIAALSLLLGNSILCDLNKNILSCAAPTEWTFFLFQILRLIIITFFIKVWYKCAIAKQANLSDMFVPTWRDAKVFFSLIFIILINFVPSVSYYTLIKREPNPDWRIESLYFAFVSIGFIIPFIVLLYYVILPYIVAGKKLPPFKQMSSAVLNNTGKIMVSTLFTITLGLLLIVYYIATIVPYTGQISVTKAIMFEISYNIVILVFVTLITNYLFNLRNVLFPSEKDSD